MDYIVAVLGVIVLFLLIVSGVLWGLDWLVMRVKEATGAL